MTKKQKREKLLQTHVININEIREAERKEILHKGKKMSKTCVFIGIILIMFGVGFSYVSGNAIKTSVSAAVKDNNILTCISNVEENGLKVYTSTNYKFKDNSLISSDSDITVKSLNNKSIKKLDIIKEKYLSFYKDTNNKSIELSIVIDNYDSFDFSTYNKEINRFAKIPLFKGNESRKTVIEKTTQSGGLCN